MGCYSKSGATISPAGSIQEPPVGKITEIFSSLMSFLPRSLHNIFQYYVRQPVGKKFPGQLQLTYLCPVAKVCGLFSSEVFSCSYGE